MLKKAINFLLLLVCFSAVYSFGVSAECEHNFEAAEGNTNLFYNYNFGHYYSCLNGCGKYGTVSGGVNTSEKCTFRLVSGEEPTCISTGTLVYMCTVCYRNKEVVVGVADHKYEFTRKLSTCTSIGYDLYECSVCTDSYIENRTEPLKHISDGGIIEVQPTYEKDGVLKVSCRICNRLIERRAIPKLIKTNSSSTVKTVRNFKVKSTSASSVKLTWKKSEGALSYKICYSTDKKNWQVKTTDKAYITVGKLKASKKYYFKVCAVGDKCESEYSKIISAYTRPSRAVITALKSEKKSSASLEWGKLKNVSGYEISYSTYAFEKNKNIKTVNVTKYCKKNFTRLKSGKKYRFRVRGYKLVGTNKIFGAYSKVKTIKIK